MGKRIVARVQPRRPRSGREEAFNRVWSLRGEIVNGLQGLEKPIRPIHGVGSKDNPGPSRAGRKYGVIVSVE